MSILLDISVVSYNCLLTQRFTSNQTHSQDTELVFQMTPAGLTGYSRPNISRAYQIYLSPQTKLCGGVFTHSSTELWSMYRPVCPCFLRSNNNASIKDGVRPGVVWSSVCRTGSEAVFRSQVGSNFPELFVYSTSLLFVYTMCCSVVLL